MAILLHVATIPFPFETSQLFVCATALFSRKYKFLMSNKQCYTFPYRLIDIHIIYGLFFHIYAFCNFHFNWGSERNVLAIVYCTLLVVLSMFSWITWRSCKQIVQVWCWTCKVMGTWYFIFFNLTTKFYP